jgi:hypothetical protein
MTVRIEAELKQELGNGWSVALYDGTSDQVLQDSWDAIIDKQYREFRVFKQNWRDGHAIAVYSDQSKASEMGIGVRKDATARFIGPEQPSPRGTRRGELDPGTVGRALNQRCEAGETWATWEWCHALEEDYRNWSDPKTLARLIREKESALRYLVDLVKCIADVATPIIDRADGG